MVVDINQRASANAKYFMQMKCTSCVCARAEKQYRRHAFSINEKILIQRLLVMFKSACTHNTEGSDKMRRLLNVLLMKLKSNANANPGWQV
jgi:hypothetical protein